MAFYKFQEGCIACDATGTVTQFGPYCPICKGEGTTGHGSFETFYRPEGFSVGDGNYGPGWYWWPCFPGCLPDCDPFGPFATEQEAIDDANG